MQDILSKYILRILRDRYYSGVTAAEIAFMHNKGDEDSLTGALGQALFTEPTLVRDNVGDEFIYSINHYIIRGKGPNSPEKKYGADGIFQIEVTDKTGKPLRRKGLLFQSKKEWRGKDVLLGKQCRDMLQVSKSAIVIDFTESGYKTCAANEAAIAYGQRKSISSAKFKRLTQLLGEDFVECRVGDLGLYYDPIKERVIKSDSNKEDFYLIDTQVQRLAY